MGKDVDDGDDHVGVDEDRERGKLNFSQTEHQKEACQETMAFQH